MIWISTPRFTVFVTVKDSFIVDTAPILYRFKGQPFTNLYQWLGRKFEFRNVIIRHFDPDHDDPDKLQEAIDYENWRKRTEDS